MAQPPAKPVATGAEERWILCIQVAYPAPEIFVRVVTEHCWDTEAKKRSRVKRDQGYEIAVRMFQREHDRWIQNALVFFGSLVSIFLIYETLEDLMPISAVLALALVIAFVTVCVSLSIRGTSDAWRDTIRTIEESAAEDVRPFEIFQNHLGGHSYREDLGSILCFWRSKALFSVTRMYTLLAIVITLVFALLLLRQCF